MKPIFLGCVCQGGAFYFLEHVVSDPSTWTYFFQHVLERLWFFLGDGCVITRATWKDLQAAGFSDIHLKHVEAHDVTFLIRPHIMGYAIKWLVGEPSALQHFAAFLRRKEQTCCNKQIYLPQCIYWVKIYLFTYRISHNSLFVLLPYPTKDVHNKYYLDSVFFFSLIV